MFVKQIRIHCAGFSYDFSEGGRHNEGNQTADPQQFQGTEPGAAEQGCHKEGREDHHRQEKARKLTGHNEKGGTANAKGRNLLPSVR